jgi:hypothetical protein
MARSENACNRTEGSEGAGDQRAGRFSLSVMRFDRDSTQKATGT